MAGRNRQTRAAQSRELARVFDATVRLYLRLSALSSQLHGGGALSGPRRTVLVGLSRTGPQTVAQMARARAQSRQRFQPLVNGLRRDGLVTAVPNPAHKQSPLIALTARGRRAVARIHAAERRGRAAVAARIPLAALSQCADVLDRVASEIETTIEKRRRRGAARR